MSISWGRRERFKFVSGGNLSSWVPPAHPAVYAVTYKQDTQGKPKAHTVLYFGESADLAQEASSMNQTVYETWASSGGRRDELYVFVHPMTGSTKGERSKVCQQLIIDYRPRANDI